MYLNAALFVSTQNGLYKEETNWRKLLSKFSIFPERKKERRMMALPSRRRRCRNYDAVVVVRERERETLRARVKVKREVLYLINGHTREVL